VGAGPVDSVSRSFGAVLAVDDVSFALQPGALTCLIGPNGSGKSTLVHCLAGFLEPDEGYVRLGQSDVTRWSPHRRTRAGLGIVFQVMRAPRLDVLESTMIGCHAWTRAGFLAGILRPPWQRREERLIRDEARRALDLVGLERQSRDRADALPLGQLRLLWLPADRQPTRVTPSLSIRKPLPVLVTVQRTPAISELQVKRPTVERLR
jgi:ABC-type branched-subunit amino acid transport system ATPase component